MTENVLSLRGKSPISFKRQTQFFYEENGDFDWEGFDDNTFSILWKGSFPTKTFLNCV